MKERVLASKKSNLVYLMSMGSPAPKGIPEYEYPSLPEKPELPEHSYSVKKDPNTNTRIRMSRHSYHPCAGLGQRGPGAVAHQRAREAVKEGGWEDSL